MRFDIITIFPEFFVGPLDYGIVRRARQAGLVETHVHDLREFTHDRHRTVDDRPFGGSQGMVLKPEPLFEAVETVLGQSAGRGSVSGDTVTPGSAPMPAGMENRTGGNACATRAIVLLSAAGKLFRQETAWSWAQQQQIILLCGRYEGVDERVAAHLATEEISVGDFVVSGGELPAAMIVDAVTRLLPGALGNEASPLEESFGNRLSDAGEQIALSDAADGVSFQQSVITDSSSYIQAPASSPGILDCPHYTRPHVFRDWAVPEVLLSGNHAHIRKWRRRMALAKTLRNRPELLAAAALSGEERRWLAELQAQQRT